MSFILEKGNCEVLLNKIEDKSVDLVLTDPPYGILNHKIETKPNISLIVREILRVLKPDGVLAYFGKVPNIYEWFEKASQKIPFRQEIIWDKMRGSLPCHRVLKTHENVYIHSKKPLNEIFLDLEFCILNHYKDLKGFRTVIRELKTLYKNPRKLREYADFLANPKYHYTKCSILSSDSFIKSSLKKKPSYMSSFDILRRGYKARSVVTFSTNKVRNDGIKMHHPTIKPISLMEYLIELCSNPGDLVFDPFAGTASTGVAALRKNRRFLGFELFDEYYKIAEQRLIDQKYKMSLQNLW